jgi:ribosomal protein S16
MKFNKFPYRFKLKRFGRIRRPTYEINLAVNRKFKERIGIYNTELTDKVRVYYSFPRFLYWVCKGARPGKGPQLKRAILKILRLSVLYVTRVV